MGAGTKHAASASPPAIAQLEIEHMLAYVTGSDCEFRRNGFWFTAKEAESHMRTKYSYLESINLIHSAEDFIDLAASKSSVSGLQYEVRCKDQLTVATAPWLQSELARFRAFH